MLINLNSNYNKPDRIDTTTAAALTSPHPPALVVVVVIISRSYIICVYSTPPAASKFIIIIIIIITDITVILYTKTRVPIPIVYRPRVRLNHRSSYVLRSLISNRCSLIFINLFGGHCRVRCYDS